MSIYKYPIKYICGSGAQVFPPDVFERKIKYFDDLIKFKAPITGETGIDGLLIDFNYGLRLQMPEGNWHVRITDAASDYEFLNEDISAVTLISIEKYLIEWEIAVWLDGEPVFYHQFDPRGQNVHFYFTKATLGDNLTLLIYVEEFRRQFDCQVSCQINEVFHGIMKQYYPDVRLEPSLPADSYACYFMTMPINLPFVAIEDGLLIPLRRLGHAILRRIETPPKKIFTPTKPRAIEQKYVCIGVQASSPPKCWLNPGGWDHVVDYLKSLGYRVLCIDRDRKCSKFGMTIKMPRGSEDFSGSYNLIDRINQLAYADFFIGLSSGLSWLAWSVDIPVVMISGITARWYEFDNPYRINNPLVCHGCFNECRNLNLVLSCPLFKDTERAFECSKKISARQVINAIDQLIADRKLEAHNGRL